MTDPLDRSAPVADHEDDTSDLPLPFDLKGKRVRKRFVFINGGLDPFMEAWLRWSRARANEQV